MIPKLIFVGGISIFIGSKVFLRWYEKRTVAFIQAQREEARAEAYVAAIERENNIIANLNK